MRSASAIVGSDRFGTGAITPARERLGQFTPFATTSEAHLSVRRNRETGDMLLALVTGGRLLSLFGKLYCSAIVGSLWESRGKRRLYGTLVNPADGVFDLGTSTSAPAG